MDRAVTVRLSVPETPRSFRGPLPMTVTGVCGTGRATTSSPRFGALADRFCAAPGPPTGSSPLGSPLVPTEGEGGERPSSATTGGHNGRSVAREHESGG